MNTNKKILIVGYDKINSTNIIEIGNRKWVYLLTYYDGYCSVFCLLVKREPSVIMGF